MLRHEQTLKTSCLVKEVNHKDYTLYKSMDRNVQSSQIQRDKKKVDEWLPRAGEALIMGMYFPFGVMRTLIVVRARQL